MHPGFPYLFHSKGPSKSILINDMGNNSTGKCNLIYWGSFKVTS